ncbi:MAG TPA: L,D-transpeptidase family protein [Steroidobacteraceae bacterium]|jgi:murein L,D-transpeptidase YcbB/YkuD|nr:L,D-transpeptidase family protein [Steroidobacteraceae bacterium]
MDPAARVVLIWIACIAVGLHARQVAAQAPAADSDPVALAIAAELDASMSPEATTIHGARLALQAPVQEFYSRRAFRPAWSNRDNAAQLRKALADSYDDGLNPADYHLPLLEELSGQITQATATDVLRAQYDVLLTEALLRLAYHLSFGKVDPETFDAQWNYGRTLAHTDVAQEVEQALAAADVYQRIEALKPTQDLYVGLKRELARFRAAAASDSWPTIAAGQSLTAGMSDARVPVLRARLIASGDLAADGAGDSPIYDSALEAAVRMFQQRMGLQADGVAGSGTIAELNVPLADRIRQLRVNLDRGRVLLRDLPDEFVVVNIAGFTAHLVRARQFIWSGRVQVGKPYRRTPIFRSQLSYVVFNPTWTVPPGIIANDILPAAKLDPDSITRKGLKVLDANGRALDPHSVDWSRFNSGHIPYTLRQDPGPSNALGRVKLMFANPYFVYLHDTPSQSLFERAERSFSSGCVRVERALELTQLVLNDQERWNDESIAAVLASGESRNVTLKKSIPVLLTYWTAWVDPQGRTQFRRDIYGQDDKWAQALEAEFRLRAKPLFSTAAAEARN